VHALAVSHASGSYCSVDDLREVGVVVDPKCGVRLPRPGELLDGILHVTGQLPEGFEPFDLRIRLEFYDEADGRTRLELRHWLPEHLVALGRVGQIPTEDWISRSEQGALESFTKLDATLAA
jgi:hypothetical protein